MLALFIVIIVLVYLYKKSADKGDIICAARNNPNPDVIKDLIRKGCNIESGSDGLGYTPLLMAIKRNPNPEIARILIKSGANINQISAMDSTTPLSLLLQQKNPSVETLDLLLKKNALVSIPDCRDKTALDYAYQLKCPERDSIILKLENQRNYEKENIKELCIVEEEDLKIILHCKIEAGDLNSSMSIYKIEEDSKYYGLVWPFYFHFYPTGMGTFMDKNDNKTYRFQIYNGNILYVRDEKGHFIEDNIKKVIQSLSSNLSEKLTHMYNDFSKNSLS